MPTLPSSRECTGDKPKVTAHERELERVATPAHPQRDTAAGPAEDPADCFLERETRRVRTVDAQDHVAGLDPRDAGGAGDGAANEQAARPGKHHDADAAVASDIRASCSPVLGRSEKGRVAVVQRCDQPGHRRLREHRPAGGCGSTVRPARRSPASRRSSEPGRARPVSTPARSRRPRALRASPQEPPSAAWCRGLYDTARRSGSAWPVAR